MRLTFNFLKAFASHPNSERASARLYPPDPGQPGWPSGLAIFPSSESQPLWAQLEDPELRDDLVEEASSGEECREDTLGGVGAWRAIWSDRAAPPVHFVILEGSSSKAVIVAGCGLHGNSVNAVASGNWGGALDSNIAATGVEVTIYQQMEEKVGCELRQGGWVPWYSDCYCHWISAQMSDLKIIAQ